jgi:mgtE-like transporter
MRGSIYGALAARLSTGILTGQFEPALVRRSFLGRQIEASTLLTVTTSVEAGTLAWGVSRLFGWQTIPLLDLVAVSLVAGLLSSAVLLWVTVSLARRSLARDWSMDDVGAPTITATGDLITLPALLVATLVLRVEPVAIAIGALGLAGAVVAAIRGVRIDEPTIRRIIRESLVVLTVSVTLQVLAGGVIESRVDQWLVVPALLVMIPPFVANCGSLGGMLASRLASKLHVGLLEPKVFPGKLAGLDFSLTFLLALLAFVGVGGVGWLAALLAGLDPPALSSLVLTSVVGGLMATVVLALVAYGAATATFRFGLDPDNHGIPIVTASMDLLGILCLVAAIGLTKVG